MCIYDHQVSQVYCPIYKHAKWYATVNLLLNLITAIRLQICYFLPLSATNLTNLSNLEFGHSCRPATKRFEQSSSSGNVKQRLNCAVTNRQKIVYLSAEKTEINDQTHICTCARLNTDHFMQITSKNCQLKFGYINRVLNADLSAIH